MQPALRACWRAYTARLGLDQARANRWLLHATELAGARLLQTAYEAAQMATWLSSGLVLHLQLSLNILQRPREAAVQLLGIAPQSERA